MVFYSRPTVYVYLRNFVSIGLFCRPVAAENPNFCRFWTRHLVVSPIGSSLRQLNTGIQLNTHLPYPTASKSFLCSHAFMVESGAQCLTFKSVTNRQTNKKIQRFWLPRRRVKSEPHQTSHGDRGPRARSCTLKTFGVLSLIHI